MLIAKALETSGPPEPAHLTHPGYRPDIDGLRALGVLLVVAFHAFPRALPGGFVGVDIFFVVSGYLISTIIFGNIENGSFSFREFYSRRIRRIFPALAIVLITGWALGWLMLFVDELQRLGTHIAAGTAFVSNIVLWSEAGYFDGDAYTKPLLHLWSLGIEEQFYIVWPLLLALVWRRKESFLRIAIIITIGSFAANIMTVNSDPVAAFYSPWSRVWELMIGGILAYLALHERRLLTASSNWQSAVGLLLILIGVALLNKKSAFPGWWALLPVMGTFLVIRAGPDAWPNRKLLSNRGMVWIGLISYPLYLWHWLLLSFAWIAGGKMPPSGNRAIMVAASFLLAYLTYFLVEKPIRAGGTRITILLVAAMSSLLLVGLATHAELIRPRNDNKAIGLILEAIGDWEYPSGLQRTSFRGIPLKSKAAGRNTVLFIGDSHIEQYAPRVVRLLNNDPDKYRSVLFLTSRGCSPIPGSVQVNSYHTERCADFREQVARLVLDPGISAVVVGGAWNLYFLESASQYTEGMDLDFEFRAIGDFLKSVSANRKVYFVLDNASGYQFEPRYFFEGTRLTRLKIKPFQEKIPLAENQALLRARLSLLAAAAGAIVVDPVAHLCPGDYCRAFTSDGKPVYKDDNHYRASYVKEHVDFIDRLLEN